MKKFITIEEARKILFASLNVLDSENINITEALGRIASEDIFTSINMPNFRKSPFDGYTLRSTRIVHASYDYPVELTVDGIIAAGQFPESIKADGVYKIMTGGLVPDGYDCVVKKEDTDKGDEIVTIYKAHLSGENVISIGEDVKLGDKVIEQGTAITPGIVAMLTSIGYEFIQVYKKPSIALLTTGDEIIELGQELGIGQIYNSNRYALEAYLTDLKTKVRYYGIAKDDLEELKAKLHRALLENDLVITTGGVSVGDFDHIGELYELLGIEKLFWGVQMKPGTPLLAGRWQDKLVISLPGSPAASLVAFEIIAAPVIRKLKGQKKYLKTKHTGKMIVDFKRKRDMPRILRVIVEDGEKGYEVRLSGKQNAGVLHSLIDYNALAVIGKSDECLKKGDLVDFYFNYEAGC